MCDRLAGVLAVELFRADQEEAVKRCVGEHRIEVSVCGGARKTHNGGISLCPVRITYGRDVDVRESAQYASVKLTEPAEPGNTDAHRARALTCRRHSRPPHSPFERLRASILHAARENRTG